MTDRLLTLRESRDAYSKGYAEGSLRGKDRQKTALLRHSEAQLAKIDKLGLDRPDREKIAYWFYERQCKAEGMKSWHKWNEIALAVQAIYLNGADQLLALIPDEEEIRKQERERIKTAKVICLCGSTRFTDQMLIKQWELTKQGYIVVTWCVLPESYFKGEDKTHIGDQEGVKDLVDEVHKRKLDLCDEVFVLNINGYIGESTASEIAYAEKIGRPINYWQALKGEK